MTETSRDDPVQQCFDLVFKHFFDKSATPGAIDRQTFFLGEFLFLNVDSVQDPGPRPQ